MMVSKCWVLPQALQMGVKGRKLRKEKQWKVEKSEEKRS